MGDEDIRLDRVCRSCLREESDMRSLFTIEDSLGSQEQRLNQMMMSSTQIQITEDDGLPCQICTDCSRQLYSAYSFKHMCELSDARLRRFLSRTTSSQKVLHDHQETSTHRTEVKREAIQSIPGNNDIIDFSTMFNSDIPSIKMEAREHPDNHQSGQEGDERKHLSYLTSNDKAVNANEKYTQTKLDDVLKLYNCSECQKIFDSLKSLLLHMRRHSKRDIVACEVCEQIFTGPGSLKRHMKESHGVHVAKKSSTSTSLDCQICSAPFQQIGQLKKHMLTHGKKKIYNCENCERGFNKGENYEKHLTLCNGRKYSCTLCEKHFSKLETLNQHTKAMHENKEELEKVDKIEPITVEVPPTQKNGLFEENAVKSIVLPELEEGINIKEEPLEELLDEAERENEMLDDDDDDSFGDALVGDDDALLGENSEDLQSDASEYKPLQFKTKRKVGRPRKNPFVNIKRKHKMRCFKREFDENDSLSIKYPCNMCPKILSSNISLKIHMSKHSGETILFTCVVCGKSFNRANHLKRHELTHGSLKKYKCDSCDRTFNRQDHLAKHMWQHMASKPHVCDICAKGFMRAEHLARHKVALHSGKEKNPKTAFCSICNRGFTTEKYLETHMRMHTGDKTFTCKVCDKSFNSKWHLKEHTKWHSAEKPFLCSECGQRFIRNDYLVIHMRRHKGEKPYKCRFCGKGFPRATDLTVHERYHTGEKTHLCTICGKGFQRQYNLTVHLRVHTGEKPYICSYCGKRFAQGNDLKSHVRRHTGERYHCEVCGEGFIQGYHLTQHKRSVHGIECTSHIRRVEKHPQANPQNQPNHIPKHRNRVTSSQQQLVAQMAATLTNIQQSVFTADAQNLADNLNIKTSENDALETQHVVVLQSQLDAAAGEVDLSQRTHSIPVLMPLVPLALFPAMHTRMQ